MDEDTRVERFRKWARSATVPELNNALLMGIEELHRRKYPPKKLQALADEAGINIDKILQS